MKKKIAYGILFIGLLVLLMNLDFKNVYLQIRRVPLRLFIFAIFLQTMTVLILGYQWMNIISWVKEDVTYYSALKMNLKGNIVDSITPGVKVGGELARIHDLKNSFFLTMEDSILVVGIQKTISIMSLVSLGMISLLYFVFDIEFVNKGMVALVFLVMLVLCLIPYLIYQIIKKPEVLKRKLEKLTFLKTKRDGIFKSIDNLNLGLKSLMKDKKKFIKQIGIGILIWIIFPIKLFIISLAFGYKIGTLSIVAITYITYIIGMIPLLPGSIGSFEGSMVGLLSMKGVGIDQGLGIAVVFRFVSFWFEFLLSGLILIVDKIFFSDKKEDAYVKSKA